MEINGYYYFYELCKHGGFSSAARALYVTQPAVSYAISKLEIQLGVQLVDKSSKKLKLTDYGIDLYKRISSSFDNLIQVEKYVKNWEHEDHRSITIAVPEHIASILIIDKIVEFNKKYPNVKFNIISGSSKYLVDVFVSGGADLLVDCMPIEFEKLMGFEKKVWANQEFVLFCDSSCGLEGLSQKNIETYKFVLPGETTNSTKMLMGILKKLAIQIDVQYYASTTDLLKSLVENSNLIGYAMKDEVEGNEKFKVLKTTIELPSYDVYKIYSKHADKVVESFIESL